MTDKGLIAEIMAGGVDRVTAEDMADRVISAIVTRLTAGNTVRIEGVGRLSSRVRCADAYCRGPGRVETRVACLSGAAVLSRGEPVPLEKSIR